MAAEILVEEVVLELRSKGVIVGDTLVQIKVGIDDLLDHLLDLVVEGQPHVFARIHSCCGIERGIVSEPFHHLAKGDAMFGTEFNAKALVQFGDDPRQRLHFFRYLAVCIFRSDGVERPGLALEINLAASRLLNPIRFHIDVLLHLVRQFLLVSG